MEPSTAFDDDGQLKPIRKRLFGGRGGPPTTIKSENSLNSTSAKPSGSNKRKLNDIDESEEMTLATPMRPSIPSISISTDASSTTKRPNKKHREDARTIGDWTFSTPLSSHSSKPIPTISLALDSPSCYTTPPTSPVKELVPPTPTPERHVPRVAASMTPERIGGLGPGPRDLPVFASPMRPSLDLHHPCNFNPYSPVVSRRQTTRQAKTSYAIRKTYAQQNRIRSRYIEEFEEIGQIGSGSYSSVYQCKNRLDGWDYAIKIVNLPKHAENSREMKKVMLEVYALSAMSHPHILRYYTAWMENSKLYIQTELCENGSLHDMIGKKVFSQEELLQIIRDVVSGLQYVHQRGLVHLDVKPENVFLSSTGGYKLGDFGLMRDNLIPSGGASTAGARGIVEGCPEVEIEIGDGRYLAPEVLEYDEDGEDGPGNMKPDLKKADMFSLGATILALARGKELSSRGDEDSARLRDGEFELDAELYSPELDQLLKGMMHPNPDCRPTADQLLDECPLLWDEKRSIIESQNEQLRLLAEQVKLYKSQAWSNSLAAKQHKEGKMFERSLLDGITGCGARLERLEKSSKSSVSELAGKLEIIAERLGCKEDLKDRSTQERCIRDDEEIQ